MKLRAAELGMLRESAPDPESIPTELKAAEQRAAESDPTVAAANAELEARTRTRDEARESLEAEQERRQTFEVLRERRETKQKALDEANEAVTQLSAKVDERTQLLARLEKLAPEASKLKEAEKTLGLWDGLAEHRAQLEKLRIELAQIPYDAKEARNERKRYDRLIEERAKLLADRPELAARVAAAKARVDALREVEKAGSVVDARQAVNDLEVALRGPREQLAVARAELAHDQAHLDEVAKGGPKTPCPVCKKPYGEEYDEILGGYRSRIATNEAVAPKLEESCQRLEKRLEKAREARDDAHGAATKLAETEGPADVAKARDELSTFERELGRIDERLRALTTEIPTLSQNCTANEELAADWHELSAACKEKKKSVDGALKAHGRSTYSKAAHAKAQEAYDRAVAVDEEVTSLREGTADTGHLKTELAKQMKRANEANKTLGATDHELHELAFDAERLEAIKEAAKTADEVREDAQEALAQAKLEAQSRSSEVKALRDRLAESKKMQEAIAAKTTEVRQHEVAADLLSRYRDHQAKRAWPRLEQGASTLLSATTDGRYADVKLSSDYRLLIVDRGEEHELARFSGGEQDLANLCLRLAIADWVSKERNVDLGFVVLDEVFGSQDDERRQRLLGELHALSNRFRQMLVITHIPDIAELCESQIEVAVQELGRSSAAVT